MKRKVLIRFIAIFLLGSAVFFNFVLAKADNSKVPGVDVLISLEDEKKAEEFKKDARTITGHFLLDSKLDANIRLYYVAAIIDTISSIKPEFFGKTYPKTTRIDIIDAVFRYYQNHFTRRHERVIDVILTRRLPMKK